MDVDDAICIPASPMDSNRSRLDPGVACKLETFGSLQIADHSFIARAHFNSFSFRPLLSQYPILLIVSLPDSNG